MVYSVPECHNMCGHDFREVLAMKYIVQRNGMPAFKSEAPLLVNGRNDEPPAFDSRLLLIPVRIVILLS
jgi:hypothetical protein